MLCAMCKERTKCAVSVNVNWEFTSEVILKLISNSQVELRTAFNQVGSFYAVRVGSQVAG